MTRIVLCAGPGLLIIEKESRLFFRRPGNPDAAVPYDPANYAVFLRSAKLKHDLSPVVGPAGESGPVIVDGTTIPDLVSDRLPDGQVVYRVVASAVPAPAARFA